ncbi:MAG: hypothetical protein ACHREM_13475 [Polyangiales bacterium]
MTRIDILRLEAELAVDSIADEPDARLAQRAIFYSRFSMSLSARGCGDAELVFTRWMLDRGVLGRSGSAWWRWVNRAILVDSALAARVADAVIDERALAAPVVAWLAWIREPTAIGWLRAHNASVFEAAARHRSLARLEVATERAFLGIVLYRLLLAQGVLEGEVLGRVGPVVSHPTIPWVRVFVGMTRLYPRHYPAREADVRAALLAGTTVTEGAGVFASISARVAEVLPLGAAFESGARWLKLPELARFVDAGRVVYP